VPEIALLWPFDGALWYVARPLLLEAIEADESSVENVVNDAFGS